MAPVARPVGDIVGRDAEVAWADGILDDALSGSGAALVVDGDAGVGKTRLVSELISHRPDALVLTGHCIDLGGTPPPYLALAEAFARLPPQRADDLVARSPLLARLLPGRARDELAAEQAVDRAAMLETVLDALAALASTSPVLLLVEDVHWADAATRDLLGFLFTRIADMPELQLGIVVTVRSDDLHRRHPLRPALAHWSRLPAVHRLHLDPLPATDIRALARNRSDGLDDGALDEIVRRADGNAFFAEELAYSMGGTGDDLPLQLAEVLLVRLDPLGDDAREVVTATAVAGGSVRHDVLSRVVDLEEGRLDRAVREAVDAHVLQADHDVRGRAGYRFRHALLAEAAYDDLLPGELRRVHARFAVVLAAAADDPARELTVSAADLVRHALAADDLATAYRAALRAARQATALGAPDEAVQQLQTALSLHDRLPQPPDGRVDVFLDLVEACLAAGRSRRALRLVRAELAQPGELTDGQRAALLFGYARAAVAGEFGDEVPAVITEALGLIADAAPSALGARLTALHARVAASMGRSRESIDSARRAVSLADRAGEPQALVEAQATQVLVESRYGDAEQAVAELDGLAAAAGAAGDTGTAVRIRFSSASMIHAAGELARAERAFDDAYEYARGAGRPWDVYAVHCLAMVARLRYARGRWDDALDTVEWATSAGATVPPVSAAILESTTVLVHAGRGADDALALAERLRQHWADEGRIAVNCVFATLPLLGRRGRIDDAVALADDFVETIGELWMDPWFPGRIELSGTVLELLTRSAAGLSGRRRAELVATGERFYRDGVEVFDRFVGAGRRVGVEATAWRARVEAGWATLRWVGGVEAPPAEELVTLAERAVEVTDVGDNAVELARTRAVLATVLRATGDSARASRVVELATGVARGYGDVVVLDALAGSGTKPSDDPARLTPREHDVLELVAQGRSNKQIAQRLFISQKTVSVHVSNILAKLDVDGRTEAAAVARERGLLA